MTDEKKSESEFAQDVWKELAAQSRRMRRTDPAEVNQEEAFHIALGSLLYCQAQFEQDSITGLVHLREAARLAAARQKSAHKLLSELFSRLTG
jgi:hypothetical protein